MPNRISESAERQPAAQLEVVIVSFRCEELLRRCLRSLEEHPPGRPMSVHVVDNASGDGTADMVEREFPDVRLTRSDSNLGFGAANNLAIAEGSAPHVLVLNPDTTVRAETLDRLISVMDSRPEVGAAGPRLELEDGTFDHAAKRAFPTPTGALGHFSRVGRRRGSTGSLAQYRAPEVDAGPVDAVNGAFMLLRREALDQVGPFDEGFWKYMEDLDLCYRLAEAGWTTWYEPSATATHVKGGTVGVRSPRLNYAFHYGMYRFYRKHYAEARNPLMNLLVYAGIAVKLAATTVVDTVRRVVRRGRPATGRPAA